MGRDGKVGCIIHIGEHRIWSQTYAPVAEHNERRHHYETDVEEGNQGACPNKDQRQVSESSSSKMAPDH